MNRDAEPGESTSAYPDLNLDSGYITRKKLR